jgi:hypothetical protein
MTNAISIEQKLKVIINKYKFSKIHFLFYHKFENLE